MGEEFQYAGEMLGATLFLVGMIISWMVWRRRGAAYGLRGVSWSLLALAAGLIGLIEALWGFVSTLFGSILNPILWAGFAVGGLGVLLYVVTGVMKARGLGTSGRGKRAAATTEAPPEDNSAAGESEAQPQQVAASSESGDDFSDIEELLRRRGIS
ncbi:cellulose synthase [Lipingzhangella sp. LS1_29]|uniref:Cellulose synthase n=1 Tax=Lipingzhangella rawalii TaxID=2055835 RepID=A0ABU2H0U8_9ACTN|nr:cellulose synthase [Lipingzhangella rawalii]MDS1268930.1 cellulose synthase [Lipingzhangella rawalii]